MIDPDGPSGLAFIIATPCFAASIIPVRFTSRICFHAARSMSSIEPSPVLMPTFENTVSSRPWRPVIFVITASQPVSSAAS